MTETIKLIERAYDQALEQEVCFPERTASDGIGAKR